MYAEGELRNNMEDTEKVRELQDTVAELKAEVSLYSVIFLTPIKLKQRSENNYNS